VLRSAEAARAAGSGALVVAVLITILNAVTAAQPVSVYVLAGVLTVAGAGIRIEAAIRDRRTVKPRDPSGADGKVDLPESGSSEGTPYQEGAVW
jgi:hypothetical protein